MAFVRLLVNKADRRVTVLDGVGSGGGGGDALSLVNTRAGGEEEWTRGVMVPSRQWS